MADPEEGGLQQTIWPLRSSELSKTWWRNPRTGRTFNIWLVSQSEPCSVPRPQSEKQHKFATLLLWLLSSENSPNHKPRPIRVVSSVCVCVCSLHTAVYLHETSVACCDKACWGTSTLRRHRCSDQAIWRMSTVNASPVQTAKKYTKREKNTYVQWICSLHLRLWNTPLPWRLYHFCLHTSAKKLIEYSWNCRNIKWWYSSPKEHFVTTCHFQCIPKVHIKSSVSMTYLGHVPEAFRSHRCDTGPFIFLTGDRCETAGECQSGTQQSEPVLPDWKQNRQDNEESGFLIENIYTS